MVLAYVLMLSLCTAQVAVASDAVLDAAVVSGSENMPPTNMPPQSPTRKPVAPTAPSSPVGIPSGMAVAGSPARTPTKPVVKPSPGKSPWHNKVTPGRVGNPRDNGSRVIVRTDRTTPLTERLAASGLMPSPGASSQPQFVFMTSAVKLALQAECASYLQNHQRLHADLEAKLEALGATPFELTALYQEEEDFWDNALVCIDERVITKMPYRRLLGVIHDRDNSSPNSASFNGKNKKNVFDHAFSYEFLCRILTSPDILAYKMMYEADLSPAKDGSMCVAYEVIELHYPTELTYVKSPNSPVGGKPTDDEVATDLGTRTSVIAFSQSPDALVAAYASVIATGMLRDMGDGRSLPFIGNRFNWIFHAQHQKGVAAGLVPVQVEVVIAIDAFGRRCLELIVIDDDDGDDEIAHKSAKTLF